MKLSCPLLLTQHLLFLSFHFSRRSGSVSWVIATACFVLTFSLFYSIPSCLLFADFFLLVIFCPWCPLSVPWLWAVLASLPAVLGDKGHRSESREVWPGAAAGVVSLSGQGTSLSLAQWAPEEEGKCGTMKLWAMGLVLAFLVHQWLEMQKKIIKIMINSNSSRNRQTPNGCGASSLRSCLLTQVQSMLVEQIGVIRPRTNVIDKTDMLILIILHLWSAFFKIHCVIFKYFSAIWT